MAKGKRFGFIWVIAVFMLTALACTCGSLGQASQGIATAQALATQGSQFATQAEGLATTVATSGAGDSSGSASTNASTEASTEASSGSTVNVPPDIPLYSDRAEISGTSELVVYQAKTDLPTITKFYQDEMPKNGWTQSQDPVITDTLVMMLYQKDNRTATFNIKYQAPVSLVEIEIAQ